MPDARLYEPASLGPWSNRGETLHASLTAQLKNVEARGEGNQRFQQHPLTQIAPLLREHCEDIEKFKKPLNEIPITGYLSKEEVNTLAFSPTPAKLLASLHVGASIHGWLQERMASQEKPYVSVYIERRSVPPALRKLRGVEWHPIAVWPWVEVAIDVAALVLVALITGWPAPRAAGDLMPPPAVAAEPITPEHVAPPPAPAPLNESPVAPAPVSRVAVDPPKREPEERKRPVSGADTARATPVGPQQPSQVQPEEVAPSESQKQESQRDEATPDVTNPSASTSSTAGPRATPDAPPPPAPAQIGPVTLRIQLTVWSSETGIRRSCGALQWVCIDRVRFAADGPVVEGHIFVGTVQPVITLNGIPVPFARVGESIVGSSRETLRPLNLVEVRSGLYSATKEFVPAK